MSRASVLLAGRRFSEEAFTAVATVRRATGATVTDPDTFEEVYVMDTVLEDVLCKVKLSGGRPADADVPGLVWAETALEWHVPMSTYGVETGDMVTIDTVTGVDDPELVGMEFRVEGPFVKSYATARRYRIAVWS